MPSFYPRTLPRQLPLTPPEFIPSYNSNGCGGGQYGHAGYPGQPGIARLDEGGYDYAERYGQAQILTAPSSMIYQQPPYSSNVAGRPVNSYFEPVGAARLPPMVAQNAPLMGGESQSHPASQQQQQQQQDMQQTQTQQASNQSVKDEKPVGGVSAKLDYDMDQMTDFVSEMAQGMYALLKSPICIADIDLFRSIQPGRPVPPSFRKWVHQVLCATRLPSATILLSLHYLSVRMTMLSTGGHFQGTDIHIYRMLTIALVLGSKFLDDNTFINRSWSEVSGISVWDLNRLEMDWLLAIDFKLHRDPSEQQGFCSWLEHWKEFERQAITRARPAKPAPIDTNVQRQRSVPSLNKPLPPTPFQSTFGQPTAAQEYATKPHQPYSAQAYTPYDHPWHMPRSATDTSPASAPITGPTTPEYYCGSAIWAPPEGYSRRTMFGFPAALSQPSGQPQHSQQNPAYGPSPYTPTYAQHVWNGHPVNCGCMYCAQRHPSYFMAPGYGPQPVAG